MRAAKPFLSPLMLIVALLLGGFRCDRPDPESGEQASPTTVRAPKLRLLILTDTKGYLEPCGCQQRPLGGVDRLASKVAELRAEGVPTLMLAAGNLFFGAELHGDDLVGARDQELWKADTLVDVWNSLGMTAVAPGPLDFSMGSEAAGALRKRSQFPWLSATLGGLDPALDATALVDAGGIKVGLVGVQGVDPGHPWPAPLRAAGQDDDIKARVAALRRQGAELVIALTSGDRQTARSALRAGADLAVAGGLDRQDPSPPAGAGDGFVLQAGRQGQGILQVDLSRSEGAKLTDASRWTWEIAQERKRAKATDLAHKIEEWEKDPAVSKPSLENQRSRLKNLRAELTTAQPPTTKKSWISAEYQELGPETKKLKSISKMLEEHAVRVNTHNAKALVGRLPKPVPDGQPGFVGSAACGTCHAEALAWWKTTAHGRAYATLERVHKEFDLSCVGCHVTGYNQPGGSTVAHVENLKDVGCENCHGPGSLHSAGPTSPGLIVRDPPETRCVGCHNAQHSARFQYDGFRAMMLAPGHGMPAAPAGAGAAQEAQP